MLNSRFPREQHQLVHVLFWSQVTEDAAAETPPVDALQEGGPDPGARRCTFLDLALALAAGVDAGGAGTLFKAARAGLAERDASVQKKAYKVTSAAGNRPVFGEAHAVL